MKKSVKLTALVMALIFVLAAFAGCGATGTPETNSDTAAAPAGKIIFGTNAEFPPFESVVANGVIKAEDGSQQYDGIDMAIAKQIGIDAGKEAVINNIEFDSLLIALNNGQLDAVIAGMTITDERKEQVDFSTPYYVATQVMIVKEGSDIQKASDMEGKEIAVVQGYTGQTCVENLGYKFTAFKKGTECVMELVNGKCDVVVIDSATAAKYVADNEGLVIVEDADAFESEEYGIAVKKGNTELLDQINATIDAMLADGRIASLSVQYQEAE